MSSLITQGTGHLTAVEFAGRRRRVGRAHRCVVRIRRDGLRGQRNHARVRPRRFALFDETVRNPAFRASRIRSRAHEGDRRSCVHLQQPEFGRTARRAARRIRRFAVRPPGFPETAESPRQPDTRTHRRVPRTIFFGPTIRTIIIGGDLHGRGRVCARRSGIRRLAGTAGLHSTYAFRPPCRHRAIAS